MTVREAPEEMEFTAVDNSPPRRRAEVTRRTNNDVIDASSFSDESYRRTPVREKFDVECQNRGGGDNDDDDDCFNYIKLSDKGRKFIKKLFKAVVVLLVFSAIFGSLAKLFYDVASSPGLQERLANTTARVMGGEMGDNPIIDVVKKAIFDKKN